MEDLRRQQLQDRDRIRALEKQLNAINIRYQQGLDGLRPDVTQSKVCCDTVNDLQNRVTDAERKISSVSESFDVLHTRLEKGLDGTGGSRNQENSGVGGEGVSAGGGIGGGRRDVVTEDKLDNRLKEFERRINNTVQQTNRSCFDLEKDLKDYFHRQLGDLRTVFLDRFDDQAFRIADVEFDIGLVKDRVNDYDQKLSKLENSTSFLSQNLKLCGCVGAGGAGERSPSSGDRGEGGGRWEAGGRATGGERRPGAGTGGAGGGSQWGSRGGEAGGGERWGTGRGDETVGGREGGTTESEANGGESKNTTEKSLQWRVFANEDQIRHFNTRLKDLSVSGDSLLDKVRS